MSKKFIVVEEGVLQLILEAHLEVADRNTEQATKECVDEIKGAAVTIIIPGETLIVVDIPKKSSKK